MSDSSYIGSRQMKIFHTYMAKQTTEEQDQLLIRDLKFISFQCNILIGLFVFSVLLCTSLAIAMVNDINKLKQEIAEIRNERR